LDALIITNSRGTNARALCYFGDCQFFHKTIPEKRLTSSTLEQVHFHCSRSQADRPEEKPFDSTERNEYKQWMEMILS
jgi:hypothetical protein